MKYENGKIIESNKVVSESNYEEYPSSSSFNVITKKRENQICSRAVIYAVDKSILPKVVSSCKSNHISSMQNIRVRIGYNESYEMIYAKAFKPTIGVSDSMKSCINKEMSKLVQASREGAQAKCIYTTAIKWTSPDSIKGDYFDDSFPTH